MKTYDTLVIFPPQFAGDQLEQAKNVVQETVKKHNGKVTNVNDYGRKFLGYAVKKSKEACLVSFEFEMPPADINAFSRSLQLIEDVSKFMVTQKPKIRQKRQRRRKARPVRPQSTAATSAPTGAKE